MDYEEEFYEALKYALEKADAVMIPAERLRRLEEYERVCTGPTVDGRPRVAMVLAHADVAVLAACARMKPVAVMHAIPGELGMSLYDATQIYAAEMTRRRGLPPDGPDPNLPPGEPRP